MEDFINVIKKDLKVRKKINDTLDKNMRLPYKDRSKIGYDCLIRNVSLKKLTKMMATTITDLDIELKMKITRLKQLESENSYNYNYMNENYYL